MTEAAPEVQAPPAETSEPAQQAPPEGQQEPPKTFDAEYVEKLRKENAKYRTEAKATATELEKVRQAAMSDSEKAVAEAEARGRTAASEEFGKRLASSRFEALASRRNPTFNATEVLDLLDLGRYVKDGEVDEAALSAAVEKVVPAPDGGIPSFDGGARTTPPAPVGMSGLIRKAAGRA